ncbi:MAG: RNA-binding transcriptional accessory protein, partial [Candidatus Aminicenantes bacterium]|nr:RNA-binding transcriptional accessory protein [Candidatus Aminicenantes bacterium]
MMDIAAQLTQELAIQPWQVENTLKLQSEGATVPFISRYRKEATGNLDETQIRALIQKHDYYQKLEDRKITILDTIRKQGKLTPDLENRIRETINKTELENLYLPYKPKRKTRATKALDADLEPLAHWIFNLKDESADLLTEAAKYIKEDSDFDSPEKVLCGACDILAEEWANDADVRKELREMTIKSGVLSSTVRKEFAGIKTKFEMYYEYKEPIKTIPSHRLLGLLRGEREKVLRVKLEIPRKESLSFVVSRFLRHPLSAAADILKDTAEDSLDRLLLPAIETEIRNTFREKADDEAIRVFGKNLRELFLAPPAGQRPVLGLDPGFRTGCKIAALDATGQFLEHQTIYPHKPQEHEEEAKITLLSMIQEHNIELIAIGNGTASRETDRFVKKAIKELPEHRRPVAVIVNESGAR